MSRTKWGWRPRKAHKMGICLLHRREVGYEEGKRKGCFSRRRCKWFRAPGESLIAAVPEDGLCPAEADEDKEPEAEEDEAGPREIIYEEVIYECDCCGWRTKTRGHEFARNWESRGEFWGAPAYEETLCCPRCGSAGLMEFYRYALYKRSDT